MPASRFIQLGSDAHEIFAVKQIAQIHPETYQITDTHRKASPRLHNAADVVYTICITLICGEGREYVYSSKEHRDAALRKISAALAPTLVIDPLLAIDIQLPPTH